MRRKDRGLTKCILISPLKYWQLSHDDDILGVVPRGAYPYLIGDRETVSDRLSTQGFQSNKYLKIKLKKIHWINQNRSAKNRGLKTGKTTKTESGKINGSCSLWS